MEGGLGMGAWGVGGGEEGWEWGGVGGGGTVQTVHLVKEIFTTFTDSFIV